MSERILNDYDFMDLWRNLPENEASRTATVISDVVETLLEHWNHHKVKRADRDAEVGKIIDALTTFRGNDALINHALKDIWVVYVNGRDTGEHHDTEQKAINAGYKVTRNSSDHYEVRRL